MSFYNGVSMIKVSEWSEVDHVFSSDSCLSGVGAISAEGEYFHREFPDFVLQLCSHIAQLECFAVVVALKTWCNKWHGRKITIHCDNEAVCCVINSGKTRDNVLLSCLREITYIACTHEFELRAIHLSSAENRLADWLSRWHMDCSYRDRFLAEIGCLDYTDILVSDNAFKFENDW